MKYDHISLMYCGNSRIFDGILISLISVARHAGVPLDVHIITMSLTDIDPSFDGINDGQRAYLEQVIKAYNQQSHITLHDATQIFRNEMMASPNLQNFYTPYALLRLFCDSIELPERIIYLDTDTVARGDLLPLYSYDLCGCEFAGTLDYLGKFFINPRYINTGVLLLDLGRIRQTGLFTAARQFCAIKKTSFPDQDALNRMAGKKRFLPRRFNEQRRMKPDTVIRHFSKTLRLIPWFHTINIKPWEIDRIHSVYKCHEFDDVFDEYLRLKSEMTEKDGAPT